MQLMQDGLKIIDNVKYTLLEYDKNIKINSLIDAFNMMFKLKKYII